jgi:hypothetical protein
VITSTSSADSCENDDQARGHGDAAAVSPPLLQLAHLTVGSNTLPQNWHTYPLNTDCGPRITLRTLLVTNIDQLECDEAGSASGRACGGAGMLVTIVNEIADDETHKGAWELYEGAFEEMRSLAVQRHLMYQSEFDEVMADTRVEKYLCYDEEEKLCGLSTYSNDLFAMPLIAPEYFERRWPELYAEKKIWYCGFVAVGCEARSTQAFAALVEAMYRTATDRGGIIALDFCRHNDDSRRMSRVIRLMLHRLSSGTLQAECMDQQSFWIYEFPSAA